MIGVWLVTLAMKPEAPTIQPETITIKPETPAIIPFTLNTQPLEVGV